MTKRVSRLATPRPGTGDRSNGSVPVARGAGPARPGPGPEPAAEAGAEAETSGPTGGAADAAAPVTDQQPPTRAIVQPSERLAAMQERQKSASELRAALEDLRRVLDVQPVQRPPRRRWRPRVVLVLLVLTVVAGLVALGTQLLQPDEQAAPRISPSPGTAAPSAAAPSAGPSADAPAAGQSSPTAGLPSTGPGIDQPGVLASAVIIDNGAGLDVFEQVVFPAPGVPELALTVPSLDGLSSELSDLDPRVSDLQVTVDGEVAQVDRAGADGSRSARSFQGGMVTKAQLRYRLAGAVMRTAPSVAGRALAIVGPLSGGQARAADLPLAMRFPDRQVLGATCPTSPDVLCGMHGAVWSATIPRNARTPVVLVQITLAALG